jgi:hypothetical protein
MAVGSWLKVVDHLLIRSIACNLSNSQQSRPFPQMRNGRKSRLKNFYFKANRQAAAG